MSLGQIAQVHGVPHDTIEVLVFLQLNIQNE